MKLPRLKSILLTPLILFAVFYLALAVYLLLDDNSVAPLDESPTQSLTIAIFGASGISTFKLAEGSNMRVIAYRPDYIGPTKEEAQLGQKLIYGFFAPVGAAVRATQIGQAMIEVTARGDEFSNGRKLGTRTIIRYSDAYLDRNN